VETGEKTQLTSRSRSRQTTRYQPTLEAQLYVLPHPLRRAPLLSSLSLLPSSLPLGTHASLRSPPLHPLALRRSLSPRAELGGTSTSSSLAGPGRARSPPAFGGESLGDVAEGRVVASESLRGAVQSRPHSLGVLKAELGGRRAGRRRGSDSRGRGGNLQRLPALAVRTQERAGLTNFRRRLLLLLLLLLRRLLLLLPS